MASGKNQYLIKPPAWWQLPFAPALVWQGTLGRCQLCRLNPCTTIQKTDPQTDTHQHWFNRLGFLCAACDASVDWQAATFRLNLANGDTIDGVASAAYTYPYERVMTRYKNQHNLTQLLPLVHAVRKLAPPPNCHTHNSVILPVPTTTKRLRERGFDALGWLSVYLSFHWQIPLFTGLARHERKHQQGLSREARLTNVKQAFYFHARPQARYVILFDDVVTTGATLQAIIEDNRLADGKYRLYARGILHGV